MASCGSRLLRLAPALFLLTLLTFCLAAESRLFQGRGLLSDDDGDVPSCAEKKRGETYKPRGGGNWKEKYDGLCIEKCGEDYDVVVHNTETDSCYCWEKDDGRWEDGDDKDVAYDVSECGSTRSDDDEDDRDSDDGDDDDAQRDSDDGDDDEEGRDSDDSGNDDDQRSSDDGDDEEEERDRDDNDEDDDDYSRNLPSCIEERPSRTYKPRGGGNWERKYSGLNECFVRCYSNYDIIVWNQKNDQCYCWKDDDGRLEESGGDDIAYDLRECENRDDEFRDRGGDDDDNVSDDSSEKDKDDDSSEESKDDDSSEKKKESEDSSEEKPREESSEERSEEQRSDDGDDDWKPRHSGGPGSTQVPFCVTEITDRLFRTHSRNISPRSYGSLGTCFERCFDASDVIVWKDDEARCYCWTMADGWWEWLGWGNINRDVSYDLQPCKLPINPPAVPSWGPGQSLPGGQGSNWWRDSAQGQGNNFGGQGSGGWSNPNQGPANGFGGPLGGFQNPGAVGATFISGECGDAQWPEEWNFRTGQKCTGAPVKTIMPGYIAYIVAQSAGTGSPSAGGVTTVQYNGTVTGCQLLFSMDTWGLLLNPDIELVRGSWLSWDGSTGACTLYSSNQACQGLLPAGPPGQYVAARYCPPNFLAGR